MSGAAFESGLSLVLFQPRKCNFKFEQNTDICMVGGICYTSSHTTCANINNFRPLHISPII